MSKSKFSILIICEGNNTEPLFFESIRDEIKNGWYYIGDVSIIIRPEPNVEKDEEEERKISRHKPQRKPQQIRKSTIVEEPEEIKAPLPLKWVLEGQRELTDGTFNEVWTVFDRDNHPARKEAFETAQQGINGTKVNIAFSSISFEYYLLLHFERIYYSFKKSECREGKKPLNCNSGQHELDCYGKKCVNGYLRNKGYLTGSTKSTKSVFTLVKDKLEAAFENSAWLRFQSDQNEPNVPEYNRNPYITTDSIIKRLTGIETSWYWISINEYHDFGNFLIFIDNNKTISIKNEGKTTMVIPEGSITEVDILTDSRKQIGNRLLINIAESEIIADLHEANLDFWFIFLHGSYRIMFRF